MSVRSEFVTGLARLDGASSKARLIAVRKAVYARIDELRDPDLRHALQLTADGVDRMLAQTSRLAVEHLAEGLAVSHGEPPTRRPTLPSANPRR
ncbi:hypothetical protein MKK58_01160 [Methylobacterium sp. J-078]|uniref:hypothetical protein n=1 Tax=Methylobacterium sp. J-078 TaxID=2836657 RepID=UPI001FBB2711|nr:hypothetical protein [Methylobacterium sp. J-078]MCJ2043164.1 hypothetical protein [Methylobacterium sp. J-078]